MKSRRLTVLQVLPALDGGGVERGVLDVARALVAAGHRSLVISAGGRMVHELTSGGTEHLERSLGSKSPLTLRHLPWLRRLMISERVDVVDIHSRMPGWITFLAWKSLPEGQRPGLISTMQGLHSPGWYSSVMCRGQRVIAVSEAVRSYIREHYRFVPDDVVSVIHRGIDSSEFPRGYRPDDSWKSDFFKHFPQASGQSLLTLAGRITRLKGHEDFLRLLGRLKDQHVAVHGLIVGGADPRRTAYADEMRSLVESLGLEGRVTFTGHRSDLKQIYAASTAVFSLSSKPESFGLTVAEALSIGTPVIGYNHGGVAEILAAEFPEGAVECGNLDKLTERVLWLLQQQPVPGPNVFDKGTMLRRTIAVYESVSRGLQLSDQKDQE
jgi:glycosyltransferase involved in cell wall biosynthesis